MALPLGRPPTLTDEGSQPLHCISHASRGPSGPMDQWTAGRLEKYSRITNRKGVDDV
jgi:hypothetical protein